VIHTHHGRKQDALFLNLILMKNSSYVFRTDLLSSIRSLVTAFTATGICHISYVDCSVNITNMTNTSCCECSIKTPDAGK